jgi:hypothetical protein
MVERSRRAKDMNEITTARMLLTTAVFAAIAALFAGGANAMLMDDGGTASGAVAAPAGQPSTIPYLSHGIGVDAAQWTGQTQTGLNGVHAALQRDRSETATFTVQPEAIPYLSQGYGVDASQFDELVRDAEATSSVASGTIPYLSQGVGVDASQFSGRPSVGLTGDSPLTRVSAPEPQGLTGDSAITRYPGTVSTPATSGGSEIDWTSFGAGAGMAALLAAAIAGVVLTTRRRGGVALP